MILPTVRDARFVTIRRGGTLTEVDHRVLALWAATCAEHVLAHFEAVEPDDSRPRQAIEHIRAWTREEVSMTESRTAGGHAMGAARNLRGAARFAAYAAGQAACVAHVALTSWALPRMRSRQRVLRLRDARNMPVDSSARGNVNNFRTRFANSSSTISACGTTSAGRCSLMIWAR